LDSTEKITLDDFLVPNKTRTNLIEKQS